MFSEWKETTYRLLTIQDLQFRICIWGVGRTMTRPSQVIVLIGLLGLVRLLELMRR